MGQATDFVVVVVVVVVVDDDDIITYFKIPPVLFLVCWSCLMFNVVVVVVIIVFVFCSRSSKKLNFLWCVMARPCVKDEERNSKFKILVAPKLCQFNLFVAS
jgi:hypothetical protein